MTWNTISKLLKLPVSQKRHYSHEWVESLMLICKDRIIETRRAGDDDTAAKLSEIKAFLKRKLLTVRTCAICGVPTRGIHCYMHSTLFRYGKKRRLRPVKLSTSVNAKQSSDLPFKQTLTGASPVTDTI